jgi:hypothetical protein
MSFHETQSGADYQKQLGIKWPVTTGFGPTDRPTIYSDRIEHSHNITLPDSYQGLPVTFWGCDWTGQLVKASFAEKIDPIFSTLYFHPDYNIQNASDRQKMIQVSHSQQLVDVWVSDEMDQLDHHLVEIDISTWLQIIKHLRAKHFQQLPYEITIGWALGQAQTRRQNINGYSQSHIQVRSRINKNLGHEWANKADGLRKLYSTLPLLPESPQTAIRLLEAKTQTAAKILNFDIAPQIVDTELGKVWRWD